MVRHAAPACTQPLSVSYLGGGPFIRSVLQQKQSDTDKVPAVPRDEARLHCQITLNKDLRFLSGMVTECVTNKLTEKHDGSWEAPGNWWLLHH